MFLPTRSRGLLRATRYLFFIAGILALGYVGFMLLDAKLYQRSAKRSLESQIQVEKEHKVIQAAPAVKPAVKVGTFWAALTSRGWECPSQFCKGQTRECCGWVRDILKALPFQGRLETVGSPGTGIPSSVN